MHNRKGRPFLKTSVVFFRASCYMSAMSIWKRLTDVFACTAGTAFNALVEAVRTAFEGDPETRRRVAFSIAMIALSAKMAKADGIVTHDEVVAFQQIFSVPADEQSNVARLYNLARQDVAGYQSYAEKIATLCGSGERNCPVLEDVLDGLFHIAKADGVLHERELGFLEEVAVIFRVDETRFETILARHVDLGARDPYRVLGVSREMSFEDIRKSYRALMREHHPDRMMARGLPEDFIRIANARVAAINAAYALIERERQPA